MHTLNIAPSPHSFSKLGMGCMLATLATPGPGPAAPAGGGSGGGAADALLTRSPAVADWNELMLRRDSDACRRLPGGAAL